MSDLWLILVVAIVTYLSRAAAVVLMPAARGALLQYVSRLPAPLFAGLAMFTLLGEGAVLPEPATLAAAVAALLVTPKRSLGVTLAAGIVGYLVVGWIW